MEEARAARPFADGLDAVEIRLDALNEPPDFRALRALFEGKTLIGTIRSAEEGGGSRLDARATRSVLAAALESGFDLLDVEYRAGLNADLMGFPPSRVILSVHDMEGLPADLSGLLGRMRSTGACHVKVVATPNDSGDAIRLLEAQTAVGPANVSLFGMGEAGIATRVLAPYLGGALAFASFVPGAPTAPGQIRASDLLDVYGVGRARRARRLFALFGGRVSHSFSPALHNASFEAIGLDGLYVPFALRSLARELPALREGLSRLGLPLAGASVTIPFKEEAAAIAGIGEPVNTLLFREDGGISSANTDRQALLALIPPAGSRERALVLGAGGLGKVAAEVLLGKGYEVFLHSLPEDEGREVAAMLGVPFISTDFSSVCPRVLVNATPLGLSGEDPLPVDVSLLRPGLLVVDGPYREGGTGLARAASEAGADVVDGFALLLAQAAGQATLFSERSVSAAELTGRLPARLRDLFGRDTPRTVGAPR